MFFASQSNMGFCSFLFELDNLDNVVFCDQALEAIDSCYSLQTSEDDSTSFLQEVIRRILKIEDHDYQENDGWNGTEESVDCPPVSEEIVAKGNEDPTGSKSTL